MSHRSVARTAQQTSWSVNWAIQLWDYAQHLVYHRFGVLYVVKVRYPMWRELDCPCGDFATMGASALLWRIYWASRKYAALPS